MLIYSHFTLLYHQFVSGVNLVVYTGWGFFWVRGLGGRSRVARLG